ncbi:MAG: BCD family MFS transporter [Rhodobacteraceae bacterium]|nr:BCD family MFS transporter [Paracoccaceae bacterium]
MSGPRTLSWLSIFRLGLVQLCLGAIVVLMTSTLNRLMVVELALPAVLPGILVGLHYGVQITRPNWGFLSDTSGNRTRWVIGGMGVLALGAWLAAASVPLLETFFWSGLGLSVLAYGLIGLGVGASGTSLLALLATGTAEQRRPAAASITWLMMIFGIAATAITVGQVLDPYSHARMLVIVGLVTGGAFLVTCLAIWGIERRLGLVVPPVAERVRFRAGLAEIWAEPAARRFTLFVFLSMTAYFMQELIMEPFAGLVFAMTPGQTTSMSGAQSGGVFVGMLAVGILATGLKLGSLRGWVVAGCLGSAVMLAGIAAIGTSGARALLLPAIVGLGLFNGMFAVAAIGSMMALAGRGRARREGTRMGLWGAAQAIAAGFGWLVGAGLADVLRRVLGSDASAFGTVFLFEAGLFLAAAALALRVMERPATRVAEARIVAGE